MDITLILIFLGALVLFGLLAFFSIRASQAARQKKQQLAESLGLTPMIPDKPLTTKISRLYRRKGTHNEFELRNVSRKPILDGEMVLFDLVDTSGEEETLTETQAIAICSYTLCLPAFMLYPKADQKYALSGLANKMLEWGITFIGKPVPFPEYPEFSARYILISDEPELLRPFFDARLAQYFAQTRMYALHAAGDLFTFSEMNYKRPSNDQLELSQRINHALEIYRQLQK